jgi:hypothetical protein
LWAMKAVEPAVSGRKERVRYERQAVGKEAR